MKISSGVTPWTWKRNFSMEETFLRREPMRSCSCYPMASSPYSLTLGSSVTKQPKWGNYSFILIVFRGMLRSGMLTGATLKASVKMTEVGYGDEEGNEDDADEE